MIHRLAFKPLDSVVSETPEILTLLGHETRFMWVRRRRPDVARITLKIAANSVTKSASSWRPSLPCTAPDTYLAFIDEEERHEPQHAHTT